MDKQWRHDLKRPRLARTLCVTFNFFGFVLLGAWLFAPTAVLAQQSRFFLGHDGTPITVTGGNSPVDHTCNASAFAQIPGQSDLFLGRARDYAPAGSKFKCEPGQQGKVVQWLALYRMDWRTHTLSYVQDVLKPPMRIEVSKDRIAVLKNVYDPSVIAYNGELWVAFECGAGPHGLHGVSSCIAPLDPKTYTIDDPGRVSVLVEGGPAPDGYIYSASVPNLFIFQNQVYVYWSALRIQKRPLKWLGATIRGMSLAQESSGLRRFWGAGSMGHPVPASDPNLTVRVVDVNPSDPMSDQSVGLKGVYATGNDIYVTASLGGRGPKGNQNCVRPKGASYGCWRLQIFHSSTPLSPDIFNEQPLKAPRLPFNPTSYDHFFVNNKGQLSIIGKFFPIHRKHNSAYHVPPGIWSFPVDLDELKF